MSGTKQMLKEQKRQLQQAKKEQKLAAKLVRREEKLARKQARHEEKQAQKTARTELQGSFRRRSRLPRQHALEVLEQIVEGLRSGTISLEHEDQQLTLQPQEVVSMTVRGRQKSKTEGLRINLRWPRVERQETATELVADIVNPQVTVTE